MRDDQAAFEYAKQLAAEEGRAEGILKTAISLLKAGVSKDLICKTTGLTPEQLGVC